jgi:2-dehydro-3-deoxygluconokinase
MTPHQLLRPGPVVCIGETMAALAPDPLGPLAGADLLGMDIAGAESNVAGYLAAHGIPVSWLSAVGDDPFGERIRATLAARGVDVSAVRLDPSRSTGLIFKDPGPTGTRVHYYRCGSAASALGPDLLDTPPVRQAALVHVSGITPALSATCRELVDRVLTPDRPYRVSFDVNYRPALWGTREAAATTLQVLAERADIVLVGLDEAQVLWGDGIRGAGEVRGILPGPDILVVKDGPVAATAFTGAEVHTVPALRIDVVEPVGAGDAFAAGFLAGLLQGRSLEPALRLGHLTAASALRVGTDHGPLPRTPVIELLLGVPLEEWSDALAHVQIDG